MHRRSVQSLGILVPLLLICLSQPGLAQKSNARKSNPPKSSPQKAADSLVSVDFSECGRQVGPNVEGFNVDPAETAKLLNGVWVGTRILKEGKAPLANYVMIYDVQAKEVLIYEERGEAIKENTFARIFNAQAKSATAPRITYFYCGAPALPPFRDEFVKVSDEPRFSGVAALGTPVANMATEPGAEINMIASNMPLGKVWDMFREANIFGKDRGTTQLNTAFYTIELLPSQAAGQHFQSIRLDMVGQLRGSANKAPDFAKGQPVAGMESGMFQGIASSKGNYLVSYRDYAVACFGVAALKVEDDVPPLTNFRYTKVVIGPLNSSARK